jgi:catechol 2,3-dioxygenase-like lactoylglutathione lyase family enzyme
MTQSQAHIGQVATIMVPVMNQDTALAFYSGILGMEKVNDFTYPSGERWLEVSPAKGSSNLCLVVSRPERPAGIETGIVLSSTDILADLAAFRTQGLDVDKEPLPESQVIWWSGAPLARRPDPVPAARSRRQLVSYRRRGLTSGGVLLRYSALLCWIPLAAASEAPTSGAVVPPLVESGCLR